MRRDKKLKLPAIRLPLNAKIVASTCIGEILAIRTNGGIMKRPRIRGNSVDDVKNRNVKLLIPSASFHYSVSATLKKDEIAIMMSTRRISVRVS